MSAPQAAPVNQPRIGTASTTDTGGLLPRLCYRPSGIEAALVWFAGMARTNVCA